MCLNDVRHRTLGFFLFFFQRTLVRFVRMAGGGRKHNTRKQKSLNVSLLALTRGALAKELFAAFAL